VFGSERSAEISPAGNKREWNAEMWSTVFLRARNDDVRGPLSLFCRPFITSTLDMKDFFDCPFRDLDWPTTQCSNSIQSVTVSLVLEAISHFAGKEAFPSFVRTSVQPSNGNCIDLWRIRRKEHINNYTDVVSNM
jgi:hypothetical protein